MMKEIKLLRENRGSVTIMAIGVMMFLGIILSGVLPMITQEVRSGTMNRDVVEAQYAAEAGLKRAIAAMQAGDTTWNWLGAARSFTGAAGKTYTVNFVTSGVCKTGRTYQAAPATGNPPASGWYCLQSVGTVNGATKTVSVAVELATMPAVFSSGIFGSASIRMDSNSQVIGPAGTNGSVTMNNNATISGLVTADKDSYNVSTTQLPEANRNPITTPLPVPTFSIAFSAPAAPTAPTVVSSSAWPLGNWKVNNSASPLASGSYTASSGLSSGQSTIAVQNNATVYVNGGNLSMDKSTWTTGNNTTIYVTNGNMSLTSNSRITSGSNSTYYVNGGIYVDEAMSLGANSTVYSKQEMQLNSNTTMNLPGAGYLYLANTGNAANANALIIGSKSVFSLGSVGNSSLLYCRGSANISDATININGPTTDNAATKVYFTGDLDLNNATEINTTGNVEIYVTGRLLMSNNSKILAANNSNLVMKMGGFVDLNNNAEIRSGTNSTIAMLIDDNVTFSNNTVIEKAVVLATGNVELNNNSNITGAIISTGSEVYMTNNSIVTYDEEAVKIIWNNITDQVVVGGGGTGGVGPVEWKSQ